MTKRCSTCKQEKDKSEFYVSKSRKDGLANECKQCTKSRVTARYHSLPKELRNNPQFRVGDNVRENEKRCTKCGRWLPFDSFRKSSTSMNGLYSRCNDCSHEQFMSWVSSKKETGEYHEMLAKRYQRNKDTARETTRKWLKTERGRLLAIKSAKKRRGMKNKATIIPLSDDEWEETLEHFGHKCVYCGKADRITIDHFIPLSLEGRHSPGNIVPACHSCNSGKRNNPPEQWVVNKFGKETYNEIVEYLNTKRQF